MLRFVGIWVNEADYTKLAARGVPVSSFIREILSIAARANGQTYGALASRLERAETEVRKVRDSLAKEAIQAAVAKRQAPAVEALSRIIVSLRRNGGVVAPLHEELAKQAAKSCGARPKTVLATAVSASRSDRDPTAAARDAVTGLVLMGGRA